MFMHFILILAISNERLFSNKYLVLNIVQKCFKYILILDIWYFILFHRISYLKFIKTYLKYSPKFVTSFVYQKVIITTPIIDFCSHRFHIGFFLFHGMMIIIMMVIMVILIHWSTILLVTASIHFRISKSKRKIFISLI